MDLLLGTELVRDGGEVCGDHGERNDESVLGGELEAHLEVVLKVLGVEAEEREVRGVREQVLEGVDHSRVEDDRVQEGGDHLEDKYKMRYS